MLAMKGLGTAAACQAGQFSPASHAHDDKYNKVSLSLVQTSGIDEESDDYIKYVPGYRFPLVADDITAVFGYSFIDGTLAPLSGYSLLDSLVISKRFVEPYAGSVKGVFSAERPEPAWNEPGFRGWVPADS